jgi:uncharacterized protein YoxC
MTDKNPMTIDDLAVTVNDLTATVDGLAVTVNDLAVTVNDLTATVDGLATMMQAGFSALDKKIDAVQHHLEVRMDQLFDERTFDAEQKESIIAAAEAYNQQLEDSSLGKKDVTLTRPEYDKTAIASGFANRFETLSEVVTE